MGGENTEAVRTSDPCDPFGDKYEVVSIKDPNDTSNDKETKAAVEITGGANFVPDPMTKSSKVGKLAAILNKESAV